MSDFVRPKMRFIKNLRQYYEIWGEEVPSHELPRLVVFRAHDLEKFLEGVAGIAYDAQEELEALRQEVRDGIEKIG